MRFVSDIDTLADAARFVVRATSSRSGMAVHAGMYLEVSGGALTLIGTDGQISAQRRIKVGVAGSEDGKAVVPAAGFATWLRALRPGGAVEVSLEENGLSCEATGGQRCRFLLINLTFPMPEWPGGKFYRVDLGSLGEGLRKVSHAAAGGEGTMTNLFMRAGGRRISVVATDSYRMARVQGIRGDGEFEAILPAGVAEMISVVGAADTKAGMYYDGGHTCAVTTEDRSVAVLCRVGAGKFPTADHLMDAVHDHRLVCDRSELKAVLARVTPFAGRGVVMLEVAGEELTIAAESSEVGAAAETIKVGRDKGSKAVAPEAGAVRVGVSARYLTDAVAAGDGDKVGVSVNDGLTGVIVYDPEDQAYTELVMPVRL